jgi:hypothetical protein
MWPFKKKRYYLHTINTGLGTLSLASTSLEPPESIRIAQRYWNYTKERIDYYSIETKEITKQEYNSF